MFEDLNKSKQAEKLPEITETDKQFDKEGQIIENSKTLDTNVTTETSTTIETSTDLPKNASSETTEMDVTQEHIPDFSNLLTWLHNEPPLSQERLSTLCIEQSDFEAALRVVQPSAKREGFATVPDVTWDDVGSLQDIRQELQMAILVNINI